MGFAETSKTNACDKIRNMAKQQGKIINARKINKMRWITGIVVSVIVIVITAVSVSLNIANYYQEAAIYPDVNFGTMRMFTTLSNILAAVAAFMCLPFQIDGLKRDKYKLPAWIVVLLYIGAVGTFLTFFIAITLLSITQGFVIIMFQNSNLFMHTINPLCITLLFVVILADARIKFKTSFLAMIPVTAYAFLYFIMVFVAKVWKDHYETNTYIPWPVSLLLVLLVAFGVAQLLRVLHNLRHDYVMKSIRKYYLESPDYECERVSDAVKKLAETESKFYHEGDDIYIPTDIIALLAERYSASIVPLDILYDIYLENYLISLKAKKQGK